VNQRIVNQVKSWIDDQESRFMKRPWDLLVMKVIKHYVEQQHLMGDAWWFSFAVIKNYVLSSKDVVISHGQTTAVLKALTASGILEYVKKCNKRIRFYAPLDILKSPWKSHKQSEISLCGRKSITVMKDSISGQKRAIESVDM
jgi:hypothetical protein